MEIAYGIYPLPNGTIYTEKDIETLDDVIGLFDYCQILEAMISKDGWDYLIQKFGMEKLYEADKISGWLESESLEMYRYDIEYEKECAYDDSVQHEDITGFCESAHFPAE